MKYFKLFTQLLHYLQVDILANAINEAGLSDVLTARIDTLPISPTGIQSRPIQPAENFIVPQTPDKILSIPQTPETPEANLPDFAAKTLRGNNNRLLIRIFVHSLN
jgi:hypothetical protein